MGICTSLFTWINFPDESFNYRWEVEDEIKNNNKIIELEKQSLISLAFMTEPEKFLFRDDEYEADISSRVIKTINDSVNNIIEVSIDNAMLNKLLDEWDNCHTNDGKAIYPPNDIDSKSYLCGDYVNGVDPEGNPISDDY